MQFIHCMRDTTKKQYLLPMYNVNYFCFFVSNVNTQHYCQVLYRYLSVKYQCSLKHV